MSPRYDLLAWENILEHYDKSNDLLKSDNNGALLKPLQIDIMRNKSEVNILSCC